MGLLLVSLVAGVNQCLKKGFEIGVMPCKLTCTLEINGWKLEAVFPTDIV